MAQYIDYLLRTCKKCRQYNFKFAMNLNNKNPIDWALSIWIYKTTNNFTEFFYWHIQQNDIKFKMLKCNCSLAG